MIMANENRTLVYVSFLFKETNGANIFIYKEIKTINNNIYIICRVATCFFQIFLGFQTFQGFQNFYQVF